MGFSILFKTHLLPHLLVQKKIEIIIFQQKSFFPIEKVQNTFNIWQIQHPFESQKYSKSQIPHIEKNKLLLNEYLRNFRHFESIFFMENDFFKPTHQKDGKFNDFLNPSLSQMLRVEYNLADAIQSLSMLQCFFLFNYKL